MKPEHPHRRPPALASVLLRALAALAVFSLGSLSGFYLADRGPNDPPPPPPVTTVPTPTMAAAEQSKAQEPPPHDLFQFRERCAPPLNASKVLPAVLRAVYDGASPYAGFPPPHAAALLREGRVRGWGSTGAVFEQLIREVRPRTIVEVGTFLGASALHMANVTRRLGLPATTILCLDDFRGWPGFRRQQRGVVRGVEYVNGDVMLLYQFMKNVVDAGEEARVVPVPFSTAAGLAALCELGVYGDLVEVDAGHDFHSAWSDINMAWAIVRPGGVLFGHDYHTSADRFGVRRAVQLFAKAKGLKVKPNGQHWVLFPPKNQL